MQQTNGFTIIEVLISVVLLSIIILVVMASLTGAFRTSGNSTLQSNATNTAQATMEAIRGQWQTNAQYDAACVIWTLPAGTTVSVQDEAVNGNAIGSPYSPTFKPSSCAGVPLLAAIRPLRRVTVTSVITTGSNTGTSQLTLEIAR